MLGHGGVLVDLVLEQRGLELILRPLVVLEHPVVSYCADQYGHNHWVLRHHLDVLFFEKVEGEVVLESQAQQLRLIHAADHHTWRYAEVHRNDSGR